jgi:hypothetical protein
MLVRGLAARSCSVLLSVGAALALAACSNGSPDANEHGFAVDGGTDSHAPDSTALGDVVVLPGDTGAGTTSDSSVATDSAAPLDSGADATLDSGSSGDSGLATDSGTPTDSGTLQDSAAVDSATLADSGSGADSSTALDSGSPADSAPPVDSGSVDSGLPVDSASETSVDGGSDAADGSCSATMAIVGGGASSVLTSTWSGGSWSAPQNLGGSVVSVPALAWNGTGFVGVVREATTNDIDYTVSGASWSALAGVPGAVGTALTIGPPALAVIGSALHLVYLGTDNKFYHGVYSVGAWTAADDPVQSSGNPQTFGPSAPTAAGLSAGFTIVQAGMDSHVYAQAWDGVWDAPVQIATDAFNVVSPRIVALTGGAATEMVVYSRNDGNDEVLMSSVLTGTTWSPPVVVHDTTVFTPNTVAIAPLANGAAVLVYEGQNGQPYYTTYSPTSATPWATVSPLFASGNPTLSSPPQIAPGVCGAQAVLVLASSGAPLEVTTLVGGSWSAPSPVAGTSGAMFAAIATQP